jgi:hypothetical protein
VKGHGQLTFEIVTPTGNSQVLSRKAIQIAGDPLHFVQDLENEEATPKGASGYYRFHAELCMPDGHQLEAERPVLVGNQDE